VFALFVRPGFERRGCGGTLLKSAVDWLFVRGFDHLRLEVGPQTRADAFYLKRGWVETGRESNGDVVMHLTRDQKQSGRALDRTAAQPVAASDGGQGYWLNFKGVGRRR
jgi:ribosomal protein S18 acetylase RimI-like enzyme